MDRTIISSTSSLTKGKISIVMVKNQKIIYINKIIHINILIMNIKKDCLVELAVSSINLFRS